MKKLITSKGEFIGNSIEKKSTYWQCDGAQIPFTIAGNIGEIVDFTPIEKAEAPSQITPRQCRLQLLSLGLLDEVETMGSANREMQIWFEYSLDFQRNHPMIEAMAVQLGLTQDNIDTMFIEASKL